MPIEITCPSCGQLLRVAALGKRVACPRCSTRFTAGDDPVAAIQAEARIPLPKSNASYDVVDEDKPRRRESDESEEQPRRKVKRRSRSSIRAMVSYPASALKIVAIAGVGLTVIAQLLRIGMLMSSPEGKENPGAMMLAGVCGLAIGGGLLALWYRLLTYTADCMYSLDNYGTAIAGCIAAIVLPCGLGWLGGVPVGIWGLVVLCLPDVRDAFLFEASGDGAYPRSKRSRGNALLLPLLLGIPVVLVLLAVAGWGLSRVLLAGPSRAQPTFTSVGANVGNPPAVPPRPIDPLRPVDPVRPADPLRPADPPQPPPAATGDASLDKLLAELESPNPGSVRSAGQKLADMQPDANRATVAQHLANRTTRYLAEASPDVFARANVIRALTVWATPNEVPALVKVLDWSKPANFVIRKDVLAAIGKFRDERALPAVMRCFNEGNRAEAVQALQAMGPIAENEMLMLLNNLGARADAIRVLKEVGTARSVPALQAIAADPFNGRAAQEAVAAIQARGKK